MSDRLTLPFVPQKCRNFRDIISQKSYKGLTTQYMITEKVDGWWAAYSPVTQSMHSSTGRVIPALAELAREISLWYARNNVPDVILIGEAYIADKPFHETNGIFNRKSEVAYGVSFTMHDAIIPNKQMLVAEHRFRDYIPKVISDKITRATVLGLTSSEATVWDIAENIWAKGGEGIILKASNSNYVSSARNSDLMKLKLEADFDLLCVNYFTTIGEKGNTAYNMTLRDAKGIEVNVRVGAYSDIEAFASASPIGKVVKIETMGRTNQGSYREPRFLYIRHDKTAVDIN